ncbi:MAG: tetratricopeptide repeat protein [Proteobacteria bacterium]|nr:tetratricopeptide repeat protein [Pseudomonadota bacterium]
MDKNEESALAYYVRLLDQFPDSELRADTLLKTFSMLTESGNSEAAGRYLQQLEDEFPDSEQVGLAKASVN